METKNILESSRTEEPVYELQMLSGLEIDITELEERLELATLQLADCYSDIGWCPVNACVGNSFGCALNAGGCGANACGGNAFGCGADAGVCGGNACGGNGYICGANASGCGINAGGADGYGNAPGCNCDATYYCGCDGDWVDA